MVPPVHTINQSRVSFSCQHHISAASNNKLKPNLPQKKWTHEQTWRRRLYDRFCSKPPGGDQDDLASHLGSSHLVHFFLYSLRSKLKCLNIYLHKLRPIRIISGVIQDLKSSHNSNNESCLIQTKHKSITSAGLLNNAHGSKMRDRFSQGQPTVRVLINNDQDPFRVWSHVIAAHHVCIDCHLLLHLMTINQYL